MPLINSSSQLKGAFFHWLGKVNTFDNNFVDFSRIVI